MKRTSLILILASFLLFSCATIKYKKHGKVKRENFLVEIPFNYVNGHIFIDVIINDNTYTFLFDTGAELNIINKEIIHRINYKKLGKGNVTTDLKSQNKIQQIEIECINIGNVDFYETVGMVWDFSHLSKYFGCVDLAGIIGNNLMRKANWQIDYQNKRIRISDSGKAFKTSNKAYKIKMNSGKYNNVLLNLKINEKEKKFTFDTGFNGKIQTGDLSLLNKNFLTSTGANGSNLISETTGDTYYTMIDRISLGQIKLNNQSIIIKKHSSSILGNEFLENYRVTINWKEDILYLDPVNTISSDTLNLFEVILSPNYNKELIEISQTLKEGSFYNKIELQSKVLSINGLDVSNLNKNELCNFWLTKWKEFRALNQLSLVVEKNKIKKTITIHKIYNK